MALTAQKKMDEAKRMAKFLDCAEAAGLLPRDMVTIKAFGLGGNCEMSFSVETLRHLVAMERE